MNPILEALQALAALPNPRPERPMFLAHPEHAADPEGLALLRAIQSNGVDVRIMRDVRAPAVPLDEWLTPSPRCTYCDGTGDVHGIDGEWRGACHCQNAEGT